MPCTKLTYLSYWHIDMAREDGSNSAESLLFGLGTLKIATKNFSDSNKLGKGGFGPVYKVLIP